MRHVTQICLLVALSLPRLHAEETKPEEPKDEFTFTSRRVLAGYANGGFFLRDPNDWFVLLPKGRLQVDTYFFPSRGPAPAGVDSNSAADPRPRDTIFVRRARVELQGTVLKHFDFHIAGEFTSTPSAGQGGILADAYIIADIADYIKLQAGQFDIPFSMENRTSDKYIDFMERGTPIRAFAVPTNKDFGAMAFGWLPKRVAYYSFGLFNGDGQNFKNQDNNLAIIGRGIVAPVAWLPQAKQHHWLADVWVGASFWWQHNTDLGAPVAASTGAGQNDIPTMTTQGGFAWFNASYNNGKDALTNNVRSHLVPWGDTVKWAVEANVPIKWVTLRFELMHQSMDIARYDDNIVPSSVSIKRNAGLRGGNLDGYGWYLQLSGWILGDVNFIETPGLEAAPRVKRFAPAPKGRLGLQVLAKYEHTGFDVVGLKDGVDAMGNATSDPAAGHYSLDTFELGANLWFTRHMRVTVNYLLNYIDGTSANVRKNNYYQKAEHELLLRAAIAL